MKSFNKQISQFLKSINIYKIYSYIKNLLMEPNIFGCIIIIAWREFLWNCIQQHQWTRIVIYGIITKRK